jgi:hypothetical protein
MGSHFSNTYGNSDGIGCRVMRKNVLLNYDMKDHLLGRNHKQYNLAFNTFRNLFLIILQKRLRITLGPTSSVKMKTNCLKNTGSTLNERASAQTYWYTFL